MRNRIISDICGNRYYIEEARDYQGYYLEVSEVVKVDKKDMKTYLCDIDQPFNAPDNEILDDIDDIKEQLKKE